MSIELTSIQYKLTELFRINTGIRQPLDKNIDADPDGYRKDWAAVRGILVCGVKDTTIQRKRDDWDHKEVEHEYDALKRICQGLSYRPRSRLYYHEISVHHHHQNESYGERVDDPVKGVDCSDTQRTATECCDSDEESSSIQLQDDIDIERNEHNGTKHNWKKKKSDTLQEVCIFKKESHPQKNIENGL